MEKADHSEHRERVRNRFMKEGLANFELHNVLEFLLFFSIPRNDTNETAHRLIDKFGSFYAVFEAPYEALLSVPGIGERSAMLIKLIPEIWARYYDDMTANFKEIKSSEAAAEYFIPKFFTSKTEQFYIITLDNKCTIKKCSLISEGGFTYTEINTRKTFGIGKQESRP